MTMCIEKTKELSLLAEQQQKQPQKAASSLNLTGWAGDNQKSQSNRAAQRGISSLPNAEE